MALTFGLFFDGTGNNRRAGNDAMSNVGKLSHLYANTPNTRGLYVRGVGSQNDGDKDPIDNDFGEWTGLGAAFGKGGKERMDFMLSRMDMYIDENVDHLILDLFGFSRGAAIARAFANVFLEDAHDFPRIKAIAKKEIRFIGIFDTVGSFAMPGDDDDPYNFHLDKTKARFIYHMVSRDELRANFDLQSLRKNADTQLPPTQDPQGWMVEQSFPGVHSDIGGGYPGKDEKTPPNTLARIYLEIMHKTATDVGVPLAPLDALTDLSTPEDPLEWEIPRELSQQFQALMDIYDTHPDLLQYQQALNDTKRRLEVLSHPSKNWKKALGRLVKSQKEKHINYAKKRIAAIEQFIIHTVFNGDESLAQKSLKAYEDFYKNYIHKSHGPFNTTVGMAAQTQKRDRGNPMEAFIADTLEGFELDHCFRRDIFWNQETCTQFIHHRPSVTCHLQFISRDHPEEHFPPGVEIEIWDKDFFHDTPLGVGTTDAKGRASVLCFDLDEKPDLFFAFKGEGKTFPHSGAPLPAQWESWDEPCLLDPVDHLPTKGRFPDLDPKVLGSLENPRRVYV